MLKVVDLILAKPNQGMDRMKSRSMYVCETMIGKFLCIYYAFLDFPSGLIFYTVDHWTTPLHGTLPPLLEGYQVGLRSGDVESAAYNRE